MGKPKFQLDDVKAHARGKWDMIFPQFAITMLPKKRHSPCPACGGSDRFRYDDKKEMGDFYCNGCGAGDGFELISRCTNLSFPQVLEEVAAIVGLTADTKITDADRKRWKKEADMRERIRIEEEEKSIKMPHVKRKVCGEVLIKVMIALTWNENKCQILDVLLIMKVT